MATQTELKKVRLSVSNAVHSLTVLVAHEEGLFREQGLDVEILKTPGSANVNTPIRPEKSSIDPWKSSITAVAWTNSGCVNGA